jgi:dihydroorotase-like cyclic amidohydrolase
MSLTLFRNIRVFDGDRAFQGSVVIKEGVISSVIESGEVRPVTKAFTVVEGEDFTLLPGLIDSHVHAHLRPGKCAKVLEPALSNGITTLLDMHNNPDIVQKLKQVCASWTSLPDLKSACYAGTVNGGWPLPIVLHHDDSEQVSTFQSTLVQLLT